jgi:N-acetylglucosaminyldiphosphoundecaprenol N-acetyl-beta-D-mannosaminyltransferase
MNTETATHPNTMFDKVPFGRIHANVITLDEAMDAIATKVKSKTVGYVVTPNVDHVCVSETSDLMAEVYENAFLSLPDGMPLIWMSKLRKRPLPEKVSGSDVIWPLLRRCAAEGFSTYFFGASRETSALAIEKIRAELPTLKVVGASSPLYSLDEPGSELLASLEEIRSLQPDVVIVAMGNPKQEHFLLRQQAVYGPGFAIGLGASLDFIAGTVSRAPKWMSDAGVEWLYRLAKEPKRLWRRYLVQDRAIVGIFLRDRRNDQKQPAARSVAQSSAQSSAESLGETHNRSTFQP